MKTLSLLLSCGLILFLTSCDESRISYDEPFSKNSKDLTDVLGNEITLKNAEDTLQLKISSNNNLNLITDAENGDTLFIGTVSKYRSLYYFNQKLSDGTYWIYAVKINTSEGLIYGLNSACLQMSYVQQEIKKGKHQKLLVSMNSDSTEILLHPDKREMRKLYSEIFNTEMEADTIITIDNSKNLKSSTLKSNVETAEEEFEYVAKVYPNPTTEYVTIQLQENTKLKFQLIDISGKVVSNGELKSITTKIDLSSQANGVYTLTLISQTDNQKENIRIVKAD